MNKNISVIIPVYNEEKAIGKCLDSLFHQTKPVDEIIIIDDGSTDETIKEVKKYPIKLLRQVHQGPGAARNLGSKSAKGDILVFVDADMTFDDQYIEKLTNPIINGNTKGTFNSQELVSNYENIWAKCWNINQNLYSNQRMHSTRKEDSEDFRAILKSEFERVGGFSLTGYTDSRTLVPKLGYRPTPVDGAISYHDNPSNLSEVFVQSRWIGKRPAKLGFLGKIINLVRYSLTFSIFFGLLKSILAGEPKYVLFKIVYDLGFESGIVSSLMGSSSAR